ncbi:MAG: ComEC/Rec2 family competence protein, partial [Rhodospirillaceae bacterium]|nr:ComEC/Rec2 family competence protein [Rhodospirillaceae bacterium]
RADMVARIDQALDPPAAGFAAALLTGQRGGVDDATYEVLRDAGLAHLLAISGLHVGLVAGGVFVLVRLLGSLNERLAVTRPIKKWAAVAALLSAVAYMLVVGAPVPTQRAVLMTGLVLLGVLADREALSMRLVAWAALVVLVLAPDSVVSASFQMSFAAVVGLVAAYEWLAPRMGRWRRGGGMARAVLLYLAGVLVSTAVAGLATAPFSLFHFQAVATAGALANLLAVPLTAFWIMPFGMAAYLAMPLGVEEGPLYLMGLGVSALVWIAGEAAQLAGGSARFAPPPAWGLALLSLGGLWLCLWRRPWRLWGCLAVAAGLASSAIERPPDLLVSDTADLTGLIEGEPRHLVLTSLNRERFAARAWADRFAAGAVVALADLPEDRQRCDGLGCIVHHAGTTLALVADPRALDEDCAAADLLVAEVPVFQPCAAVVIDRFDVWRHGAHAVWLGDGPPRIETVAEHEGDRPWALTR